MDCLHWWGTGEDNVHEGPDDIVAAYDKVLRASQTEWAGLAMRTAGKEIMVLVDTLSICCETVSITIRGDPKELLKSPFVSADLNVKREKALKKDSNDSFMHYLCVDIVTEEKTFEIDISNEHNGYYSHEVLLQWPGHSERTDL